MEIKFARRTEQMNSSVVRETLKLTAKPDVISFAGGMPAPEVFPVRELQAAMNKVLETSGRVALQYGPTDGYLPLREKIAARHRKAGISCTADDILMISGSQQGLDLAGKLFLDPGDLVVCESPTYTAALSAFRAYECGFLPIDTDDDGMIIEDLERKLAANPRAKVIYVIPTFQNPTGRTWSLERRKGLLKVAEKYALPILEDNPYGCLLYTSPSTRALSSAASDVYKRQDNPYGDLRYEGEPIPPLKAMDTQGLVIYMGSFSKTLSPGIRLGWILAAPELLQKFNTAKQGADLQASTIMQMVVNTYLEDYDLDENIRKLNALYHKRRDLMLSLLEQEFPKGSSWTHPQGGLFIWVTVPEQIDTAKIMPQVVARKVAYIPGHSFFADGGVTNTLRLNFSNASEEKIITGMKLMGEVLREQV